MLVFVYGTLTDPDQVDAVLDDWRFAGPATLSGCHRVDGRYPTLSPGGTTDGRLLATPAVEALDDYERVDQGLYVRVAVPLSGFEAPPAGAEVAAVYVGDPDRLDADASWPGDEPFAERVRAVVDAEDVVVRPTG